MVETMDYDDFLDLRKFLKTYEANSGYNLQIYPGTLYIFDFDRNGKKYTMFFDPIFKSLLCMGAG